MCNICLHIVQNWSAFDSGTLARLAADSPSSNPACILPAPLKITPTVFSRSETSWEEVWQKGKRGQRHHKPYQNAYFAVFLLSAGLLVSLPTNMHFAEGWARSHKTDSLEASMSHTFVPIFDNPIGVRVAELPLCTLWILQQHRFEIGSKYSCWMPLCREAARYLHESSVWETELWCK